MRTQRIVLVVLVITLTLALAAILLRRADDLRPPGQPSGLELVLKPEDRLLVLAPHPDDEVLGCGGIIQQAIAQELPVHVAYFTYGDFYEWAFVKYKGRPVLTPKGVEGMGQVRHGEALAAMAALGLSSEHVQFLGYPDFGTLDIWYHAWGPQAEAVRGILTRAAAVPYPNALRPGAPYKGDEVVRDLKSVIQAFRPTKVFVSHAADHHPDHRALHLFTRIALFDLEQEISPGVFPHLVHYTKWPAPQGFHPEVPQTPPAFLADQIPWVVAPLVSQQISTKREALRRHATQYGTTPAYLDAFVRSNELFGGFPAITLDANSPSQSPAQGRTKEVDLDGRQLEPDDALLAGVVKRTARVEGGNLHITIELTHPLAEEVGLSIYLFGYRRDRVFAEMPKLHLKFSPMAHEAFDQKRAVPLGEIRVMRSERRVDITVPLERMGNPQRILTSAQTYAGVVPLSWASWQLLRIQDPSAGWD